MALTDVFFLISGVILFWRGWKAGMLRTLLGPLSLALGLLTSYLYYKDTQNVLIAVLISIIGPIVFNLLLFVLLQIWRNLQSEETAPGFISRLSAAAVNLTFGLINLSLVIVFIMIVPDTINKMTSLRQDVQRSITYRLVSPYLAQLIFHEREKTQAPLVLMSFSDPKNVTAIQASPEFQDVMNDEKLKNVFTDNSIVDQVNKKEYAKLMANPKVLEIIKDQKLLKKMIALYAQMMRQGQAQTP